MGAIQTKKRRQEPVRETGLVDSLFTRPDAERALILNDQISWILDACLPFGPFVTSKLTRCPSLSDLKPCMLIAEKWANKSSSPSSGVIKPKPFASLNHLTVPVAILHPCINRRVRPNNKSLNKSQGLLTSSHAERLSSAPNCISTQPERRRQEIREKFFPP